MLQEFLATRDPEWTMTVADAHGIAVRFCNVARHYSLFKDVDPKTKDWRLFMGSVAIAVMPRAYRITMRKRRAKEAAKAFAQQAAMGPGGTIVDLEGARRPPL